MLNECQKYTLHEYIVIVLHYDGTSCVFLVQSLVWDLCYHTIIRAAFVCLFVCLFVPYVLRGPLTDLRQTWWVYVGWPPICPWGVLFRKGQRVDGSTGHFCFPLCYICSRLMPHHCKKHTEYDSRQHQTHATPLTKAHGIFCSLETGNFLVLHYDGTSCVFLVQSLVWDLCYHHTIIRAAFVCLFVPYVLWGPLTDLRQTWWVYM